MSNNLVIVESPAKAKKISQFLGENYRVMASVGHVRDLPAKRLGVDIDQNFTPEYVSTLRGKKVLKTLKEESRKCDKVFLAPDPDREGEAIAWHLYEVLKKSVRKEKFYRITYNEVTKPAILAAFSHPEKINMNRVNAQQARRVLDRLVGFKGSPMVQKQIRGAQSVGRVQTIALRLVVEREKEIEKFTPEPYFTFGVRVCRQDMPLNPFTVKLVRINGEPTGIKDRKLLPGAIKTQEQLEAVQKDMESSSFKVSDIALGEVLRRARAPFITSTLQQAASSLLGFTPSRTMTISQALYESGLITYMRTDSFHLSQTAQDECRKFINRRYGVEYTPKKPNVYQGKGRAQEAHEAIRPTDVTIEHVEAEPPIKEAEKKLYRLIWERFVASQMLPAKIARRTVEIEAGREHKCLFRATVSEIVFPGYMKVSGIEVPADKPKEGEDAETEAIPPLEKGSTLDVLEWLSEKKETRPAARYTEASLIRTLEENGVGRPSTYASIMSKLDTREYVSKQKRSLLPTSMGRELIKLVFRTEGKLKSDNKIDLFEVRFTADMETKLDEVEEGKVQWTVMMQEFYPSLLEWLQHAKETVDPVLASKYIHALEHVTEWAPPTRAGRRIYNDQETFKSLKEAGEKEGRHLSLRQGELLQRMCCRYIKQIPEALAAELGLVEQESVGEDMLRKLELLSGVQFERPHKIGTHVYNDREFCQSFKDQVSRGKPLSERQEACLNTLLMKYADQFENFDAIISEFNLNKRELDKADSSNEPILAMIANVKQWEKPRRRGKREFNDKAFFDSVSNQFKNRGSISERQLAVLKNMAARYADQIPNYAQMQHQHGLPDPKTSPSGKGDS